MNAKELIGDLQDLTAAVRADNFMQKHHRFEKLDLKDRNQLVTDLDIKVEEQLVSGLSEILPGAGFLTEEKTTEQAGKGELKWIIDPIDGTTNFVHGIPAFAISIALEDADGILAGVILELNSGEFFSAFRGHGTHLNGDPVRVSESPDLENSLIATGFPYYDFEYTSAYLEVLEEFMRSTRGVRRIGSAALDLAYVACGRFDAFYEYSLSPWDVAAGSLLVLEAGGTLCDFNDQENYIYGKSIVASQKNIKKDVMQIIRERFKTL